MNTRTAGAPAVAAFAAVALAVTLSGCSGFTDNADTTTEPAGNSVSAGGDTPSADPAPGGTVGSAVMSITGSGPATVTYSINGGPEQTEEVTLPWEKQYDVVDKAQTTVKAEGDDAGMCTIMFDGEYLVAFEEKPSCSFAHYG